MILFKDGTIKQAGWVNNDGYGSGGGSLVSGDSAKFREFKNGLGTNVTNIYGGYSWRIIRRVNESGEVEFWGSPGRNNQLGLPEETYGSTEFFEIPLPEELKDEGVKEVYTINYGVYYLSNAGKVYASGDAENSGTNTQSGTLTEVTYTGLNNIETLYNTDIVKITTSSNASSAPICFTGKDGNIYTTGQANIVFGDNILQKSWAKIAENVKYVDANDRMLAYVNKNNELFMSGDNKDLLGLGETNIENINQLFKHPDTNIQGKVDKVYVSEAVTYVLTTDGILYGTGFYTNNGTSYYPGWSSTENQKSFVEILNNVKVFATDQSNDSRIAFLADGTAYGWGRNAGGMNGYSYASTNVPTMYELPSDMGGVDNVLQMKTYDHYRSCLVTKDGKFFMSGYNTVNNAYDGGQAAKNYWYRYTHNLTLNDGEKIIQAAPLNQSNMLLLTDKGRVFGWGANCYLGLNNTSTSFVETQLLSGIDNVSQVIAGPNWYIAIKNDGTVWGTGQNTYGILGRWIGVDRSTPNSRYKKAFEWVECPELEI